RDQVAGDVLGPRQLGGLAVLVLDRDTRPLVEILAVDDDAGRQTGAIVDLLFHGDGLEHVAELRRAADLGEHRDRVGIPFGDQIAGLDRLAVAHLELGAVDDRGAFALALAARFGDLDDRDFAVAVHHHQVAALVGHGIEVDELEDTVVACLERGLLGAPARRAADVERAHGELRAGLADRLRRDDADRLTEVDHVPARQIAPVAADADALARLTGQHRADLHPLEAGLLDFPNLVFGDLLVRFDDDLVVERIAGVVERAAAAPAGARAFA